MRNDRFAYVFILGVPFTAGKALPSQHNHITLPEQRAGRTTTIERGVEYAE